MDNPNNVVCCILPNNSLVKLLRTSPAVQNQGEEGLLQLEHSGDVCELVETDHDLFIHLIGNNATEDEVDYWYGACFGASTPPPPPLEELIPTLLVYGLTFLLGIIGNVLIILAVMRRKTFKSPTNTFLASLASTDLLLILICLPVKLYKLFTFTWPFGIVMCKGIQYIQDISVICSVLNLTAMSLERFYAIVYPLRAKQVCTVSQARKVVGFTWILSFLLALPSLWIQIELPVGNKVDGFKFWCVPDWTRKRYWQGFQLYMLVIVLLLPTVVMTFAYSSISIEVIRVMRNRAGLAPGYSREMERISDGARTRNMHCESETLTKIDTLSPQHRDQSVTRPSFRSFRRSTSTTGVRSSLRCHTASGMPKTSARANTKSFRFCRRSSRQSPRFPSVRFSKKRHDSDCSEGQVFCHSKTVEDDKWSLTDSVSTTRLHSSRQSDRLHTSRQSDRAADDNTNVRQVVRMLAIVVIVFIVCWSPLLIFNVLHSFNIIPQELCDHDSCGHKHIKTVFSLLAYFNSCINPIIYGFMSRTFRQSFLKTFRDCKGCRSKTDRKQLQQQGMQQRTTESKYGGCFPWCRCCVSEEAGCCCGGDPFILVCPSHSCRFKRKLVTLKEETENSHKPLASPHEQEEQESIQNPPVWQEEEKAEQEEQRDDTGNTPGSNGHQGIPASSAVIQESSSSTAVKQLNSCSSTAVQQLNSCRPFRLGHNKSLVPCFECKQKFLSGLEQNIKILDSKSNRKFHSECDAENMELVDIDVNCCHRQQSTRRSCSRMKSKKRVEKTPGRFSKSCSDLRQANHTY